jgi:hypothetical protein
MEMHDAPKLEVATGIGQSWRPGVRQVRFAGFKQQIEIGGDESRHTGPGRREGQQGAVCPEACAGRGLDGFGHGGADIGNLEFALKQAENPIGREQATDAGHAAHLQRLGQERPRRAVLSGAENIDDVAAKALEIGEAGLMLRNARAAEEDDVAGIARHEQLVGN